MRQQKGAGTECLSQMRCWRQQPPRHPEPQQPFRVKVGHFYTQGLKLKLNSLVIFHCFLDSETQFLPLTKEWCPHFLFSEEIKWNKSCEAHSNYWFNLYQIRSFGISTKSLDWITDELTCRSQVSDLKNAEQKQKVNCV